MATRIPTIIPPGLPAGEPEGELAPEAAAKLQTLRNRLAKRSVDHLGYPYNFDHAKHLGPLHDLLRFSLNNLGDPFDPSNYNVESREFEQEVIHIYAQLWGAKPGSYWGYVAHSGTEGNRLCMDIAGRTFPQGTIYYSASTHYSVAGAATSFKLRSVCVPTQKHGEIDYEELEKALIAGRFVDDAKTIVSPAIVVLNIGTTMTGAFDDVTIAQGCLERAGYDLDTEVFVHLDGALSGLMVPFMDFSGEYREGGSSVGASALPAELAHELSDAEAEREEVESAIKKKRRTGDKTVTPQSVVGDESKYKKVFKASKVIGVKRSHPDFRHGIVASFACSGHKFLGCPMPAGVVVVRGQWVDKVAEDVEYLGSRLVTSMGSRNGHSPVFLWHELQRKGAAGLTKDVKDCLENAAYLVSLLEKHKVSCFRNPWANTVVFEKPQWPEFITKYHLACQRSIAHVVVMPSVERSKLEQFAAEFGALVAAGRPFEQKCLVEIMGRASCFCNACVAKPPAATPL